MKIQISHSTFGRVLTLTVSKHLRGGNLGQVSTVVTGELQPQPRPQPQLNSTWVRQVIHQKSTHHQHSFKLHEKMKVEQCLQ